MRRQPAPRRRRSAGAVEALTAAIGTPPQARLETRPSLLFASAAGGDRAYLDAVGLINEGRYEAAIEALNSARATFGPHPDVLTYLGFANRKLGRYETAETYYRAALAAAPDHRGATEYYGELMVERGDLAGAERMLAKLEGSCDFGCAEADELGDGSRPRARALPERPPLRPAARRRRADGADSAGPRGALARARAPSMRASPGSRPNASRSPPIPPSGGGRRSAGSRSGRRCCSAARRRGPG